MYNDDHLDGSEDSGDGAEGQEEAGDGGELRKTNCVIVPLCHCQCAIVSLCHCVIRSVNCHYKIVIRHHKSVISDSTITRVSSSIKSVISVIRHHKCQLPS